MKTKFTWKDIKESLKNEMTMEDIYEIYKGIIAFNLDIPEDRNDIVEDVFENGYLKKDYVTNFINDEIAFTFRDNYFKSKITQKLEKYEDYED